MSREQQSALMCLRIGHYEADAFSNLSLCTGRTSSGAQIAKMPPIRQIKTRSVARKHFSSDRATWLPRRADEDDHIHRQNRIDVVAADPKKEKRRSCVNVHCLLPWGAAEDILCLCGVGPSWDCLNIVFFCVFDNHVVLQTCLVRKQCPLARLEWSPTTLCWRQAAPQ